MADMICPQLPLQPISCHPSPSWLHLATPACSLFLRYHKHIQRKALSLVSPAWEDLLGCCGRCWLEVKDDRSRLSFQFLHKGYIFRKAFQSISWHPSSQAPFPALNFPYVTLLTHPVTCYLFPVFVRLGLLSHSLLYLPLDRHLKPSRWSVSFLNE